MPFDVKALLHNKPALIGIAVAGAAGLYVLVKRKQGGTGTTGTASTAAPSTTGTAYPDTSASDLAAQLGQFSGNLQNQLDAFTQNLQNTQTGTTSIPTAPTPSPSRMPVASAPPGATRARGTTHATGGRIMHPLGF